MPIRGRGAGGGGGTVDAVARALINPVVGTPLEVIPSGNQVFSGNKLWQNLTGGNLTVPATINDTTMALAGFTVITPGGGETLRYDLTSVPTLVDLPNPGDQAVITSGLLAGMEFENVSGTILYRRSSIVARTSAFTPVQRSAIAAAMLTNLPALGVGVAGPQMYFVLTQDDTVNSATAGIYSVTSYDGPVGVQTQQVAFGSSASGTSEVTRYDLTSVPTLVDLPNAGDQAVVTSGLLAGMVFENVGGTILYRTSSIVTRSTAFSPVQRSAIAAAMLTNLPALGVGVVGPQMHYVLTDDDAANLATAGIYTITAYDGPVGVQVLRVAFGGGGGSSSLTPVTGWADPSIGTTDRSLDVGTLQELTNLVHTIVADLKTIGVFAT